MAESLRGGLSLALSGFGYWSHDIGGFEGTPDAGVFKRWLAFGLLSSHSRLHGNESYRVPWAFDSEAVDVARRFTHLKMSLMPYLARLAEEVTTDGTPVMRPMVLELPDDPGAATVDTQYMLGDCLLVAPVFSADGVVDCYVPEGTWTDLLSGGKVTGPRWVRQQHGYDSLPVLVRPGTVLPVGARTDRPDYDYADGVTLRLFEIADGQRTTTRIPALGGGVAASFVVERTGPTIRVESLPGDDAQPVKPWRVQVGDTVLTPASGERFVEL
jgi:alpha-D-xyloside xylohydrolase